jgi:hypothetical protein
VGAEDAMKVTVKTALEMLQAIGQLDGYQNGSDKLTFYKYKGDIRLKIALARRKLRQTQEDYQDARNALLMEVTKGKGELPAIEMVRPSERAELIKQVVAFNKGNDELLRSTVDLDIDALPVEAFNLDENPIPPTVLDMLGDFIAIGSKDDATHV